MDRQTILGFVLITLVLLVWMWLQAPPPAPPPAAGDSVAVAQPPKPDSVVQPPRGAVPQAERQAEDSVGKFFAARQKGREGIYTIVTDLYTAEVTTRGGMIRTWTLKNYTTWDGNPCQLVNYERGGDFSLLFTSADGKLVNTRSLLFDARMPAGGSVTLTGEEAHTVRFTLPVEGGGELVKTLTFRNGSYTFDAELEFRNMAQVISNFEYQAVWEGGVRYAERNSVDESSFAMAYALSGGELAEVDASSVGEPVHQDINGATRWVATRNKYFALAMMSEEGQGAYLEGTHSAAPDNGSVESYAVALKLPYKGSPVERAKVTVYLGPLEYDTVKEFGVGLEQVMNLGAAWIIRPISEYIMLPLFGLLRMVIPNYGLVLIVFSILLKIALNPLTKTSMTSMRRMQALTPMMNEIREKYKDDPEKMNSSIMNLYRDYGVNPASGCLPMLLQLPIMYALYSVLRSSIELRQASFFGWITDLAVPDVLFTLPFTIPLFGVREVSGLALIMGVTMFIQQKMSTTDPRQKSLVYVMPVMFTLLFNSFPSGLNLYYLVFNVLSIGQQFWMNKRHKDEPLRKVEPKKGGGGIMAKLAKDMPKLKR